MFCRECGKEIASGDEFCGNCGTAVKPALQQGQPQGQGEQAPPAPAPRTALTPPVPGASGAPGLPGSPAPRTVYAGPEAPPPGSPVPPPPPPPSAGTPAPPSYEAPPAPAAAAKAGFFSTAAGKALASVIALLVVAGAALGIFLFIKSGSEGDARARADEVITRAVDDLGAAGSDLEDMYEAVPLIDYKAIDQARPQVEKDQAELDKIAGTVDDNRDELEDLDTGKLTQEQRDSIEALLNAADEYAKACEEISEWMERSLAIGEFEGCIDATVSQFSTLVDTVNEGVRQHNAEQYTDAWNTAQSARGMLSQARAFLNRAKEIEPGADLSYHFGNLDNTERFLNTFIQLCETGAAGDYDTHNALVDQGNTEDNSVSGDMSFDYEGYFSEERERAYSTIDKHLKAGAGYLEDAET